MFVTMIVLRIDLIDGTVEYVNAGHPPMLLSRNHASFVEVDDSEGLIAGVIEDHVYQARELTLAAGDRLVIYTDGVTEARNTSRRFYSQPRLIDLLAHDDTSDSTQLVSAIFDDAHRYAADTPQSDDITVVALEYYGANHGAAVDDFETA